MKDKNKTSRKKVNTNSQKYNKSKGKLLEQVVATLYQTPGVKIQTNVDYPTKDGKSTREIDILWTANISGLTVEYAFQCKNEKKPIGVGKLSQFFGDLNDVGIPAKNGIFVSVNDFAEDALRFAKSNGIKTRVFKGLSKDRLKSEISSAIQHNIFLIPRIEELSIINAAPDAEYDYQFLIFSDEHKNPVGTIPDLVFNRWRSGKIPEKLGKHTVQMDAPINWFQFYKGEALPPMKVSAKVLVLAAVITIDGVAENHLLLDAETGSIEKARTKLTFQAFQKGDEIPLTIISSEKELSEFIEKSDITHLTVKSRLPRIVSNKTYYPFSKPVAERIFNQLKKHELHPEDISQEKFDEILSEVSKGDILREGIYNFWCKVASVIVTDNQGNLVDLNLIADNGDFDKIISLSNRYKENPSNSFGNMLAWAYREKSRQLLSKAREAKVDQIDLLRESLKHIEISLEFDSESILALEQRVELLIFLENYDKALKAIDFILTKKNKDIDTHLLKVHILIKLKEWKLALKEIKDIKKLLKASDKDTESVKINIKIYQAEILHAEGKYRQAWLNILEIWQNSPEEIIKHFGGKDFVNDLIYKVNTIESRWFHIELLIFRATEFLRIHEYKTASELVDYAFVLLDDIKLIDQMKEEPIAVGEVEDAFIKSVLSRIAKLLRNTGNKALAEKQMNKISDWFERTYKEEPIFLTMTAKKSPCF